MRFYYSKKIFERFLHPKNFGKIKNPDGVGDAQGLIRGDVMRIYIKVKEKKEKVIIQEIKFETIGCGYAIAASDIICDLVKGKTIEEAKKIGFQDIANKIAPASTCGSEDEDEAKASSTFQTNKNRPLLWRRGRLFDRIKCYGKDFT